ncbi:GNAT family N-acetyltransferase [Chloroflexota bacterium]
MDLKTSLFVGQKICLAPIDHEKDPEIESIWTHDAEYMRMLYLEPMRPLSPSKIKKQYEKIEKKMEESKNLVYFAIRSLDDDRLIGFIRLYWIEWSNGCAIIELGIGDSNDRLQGYGSEALKLLLRYAFAEMNLFRLAAIVPEYNHVALHVFAEAGFVKEVRRREALNRDNQRWDLIHLGILREEWENK